MNNNKETLFKVFDIIFMLPLMFAVFPLPLVFPIALTATIIEDECDTTTKIVFLSTYYLCNACALIYFYKFKR